jgi:predicted RNase H-like HicB family nuclease
VAELRLSAIIREEDGWFVADCPKVGTASQGKTIAEALANLREATDLYPKEQPEPCRFSCEPIDLL